MYLLFTDEIQEMALVDSCCYVYYCLAINRSYLPRLSSFATCSSIPNYYHLFVWYFNVITTTQQVMYATSFGPTLTGVVVFCRTRFKWYQVAKRSARSLYDCCVFNCSGAVSCRIWCFKMEIFLHYWRSCLEDSLPGGLWLWPSRGFMLYGTCQILVYFLNSIHKFYLFFLPILAYFNLWFIPFYILII